MQIVGELSPKPYSISGTEDIGSCCICDTTDSDGVKTHIKQHNLFYCQKEGCDHLVCGEHFVENYCYGCYLEK